MYFFCRYSAAINVFLQFMDFDDLTLTLNHCFFSLNRDILELSSSCRREALLSLPQTLVTVSLNYWFFSPVHSHIPMLRGIKHSRNDFDACTRTVGGSVYIISLSRNMSRLVLPELAYVITMRFYSGPLLILSVTF